MSAKAHAKDVVDAIVQDLLGLSGLKQEWRSIDPHLRLEIIDRWKAIVSAKLTAAESEVSRQATEIAGLREENGEMRGFLRDTIDTFYRNDRDEETWSENGGLGWRIADFLGLKKRAAGGG